MVDATFVGELKAALVDEGFTVSTSDFDRALGFPQLQIQYLGILAEPALGGERVPRCEIRAATGYVFDDDDDDVHEVAEDVAIRLFDACNRIPSVIAFDYNGVTRFEPLDGTEALYFGLVFIVERSGGVRRG